jgi:uncharacterized membrane protein YgcG
MDNKNMKWLVLLFVAFGVLLYAGTSRADGFQVPPKPDNGWYISDTAGALSVSDKDILNRKIDGINKTSRNEIGIAIVSTLNGTPIEDAAQDTFHSWGIGKAGLDNGVLIMFAIKDRKARIQTGNGAEGDLPDSVCNQIIRDARRFTSKNDWAGALNFEVDQIKSKMESRVGQTPIVPPKKTSTNPDAAAGAGWVLLIFFGALALVGIIVWRVNRRRSSRWAYMNHSYDSPSYRGATAYDHPATPQSYHVPDPYRVAAKPTLGTVAAVGAGATAATLAAKRKRQAQADDERAKRDASRRAAAAPKRKSYDDDDDTPSFSSGGYSSPSSDSWSSGGGGGDIGGGFGGGDSGGGGASGDM